MVLNRLRQSHSQHKNKRMPKMPVVTTKELVKVLLKLGFIEAKARGTSHVVFKSIDGRRTTVSVHGNTEIPMGTLHAILHDIDISKENFIKILNSK